MSVLLQLDSLDGVAYAIDPECTIIDYGGAHWDKSAKESGAPELCVAGNVIGHNLFDVMAGDSVREAYAGLIRDLLESRRENFAFSYRCDSPDVRRQGRLAMTPLQTDGEITGVLFQSIILDRQTRPPLDIFRFRDVPAALAHDADRPVVTICSWCLDVKVDGDSPAPRWVSAEEYYRLGGASEVRISHGICPDCSAEICGN